MVLRHGASDEALNSGILTIDVTSVSTSLGGNLPANSSSLGPMDPLVLVAHSDIPPSLDSPLVLGTAATVLQQSSFSMDDVRTVSAGALGCLVALPVKNLSPDPQALTSGGHLADSTSALTSPSPPPGKTNSPELLTPIKVELDSPPGPDTVRQQERSRGTPRSVFCSPAEKHSPQKDTGLSAGTGNIYLLCDVGLPRFSEHRWCVVNGLQESGGSARTDSRAIQLAKKKKAERNWEQCRSLRSRSEENERWHGQSCSLPHKPNWLVVRELSGAQWRCARTSSSSRCAVRSGPVAAG